MMSAIAPTGGPPKAAAPTFKFLKIAVLIANRGKGAGRGNLRTATLIIWTIFADGLIASLGWYDVWRAWPIKYAYSNGAYAPEPTILPCRRHAGAQSIWKSRL